jgi:hypothetical protein
MQCITQKARPCMVALLVMWAIILDPTSTITAKEHGKYSKVKLKYGDIDFLQHMLTMKVSYCDTPIEFYEEIFEKYIPQDYFLECYLGFGSFLLLFRDENGNTIDLITPGRMGKEDWEPGEEEIYKSVKENLKPFKVCSAIGEPDIN